MRVHHETDVCVVGGGPAGLCLAALLVERGVRTLVLERAPDLERAYRGEILQPRFTQLMRRAGLLEHVTSYPHTRLDGLELTYRGRHSARIDIAKVAPDAPQILWMPQPVLLGALRDRAAKSPGFELWHRAKVVSLIEDGGRITGVVAQRGDDHVTVRARVVVGADGRASTVRTLGGFVERYARHSLDVLWFEIPAPEAHPARLAFVFDRRCSYLVFPRHPASLQCGIVLPPGRGRAYLGRSLDDVRAELRAAHPMFTADGALDGLDRLHPLRGDLALVDRWARDGCLLIGDAAHTCSPIAGIGVSIAIGTAIRAADVIAEALAASDPSAARLDRVQAAREPEIRRVHRLQRLIGVAAVRAPRPLRYAGVLGARLLARLGILPRLVRRLLVER